MSFFKIPPKPLIASTKPLWSRLTQMNCDSVKGSKSIDFSSKTAS